MDRRRKKTIENFENVELVGRGAFGEVRLVKERDTGKYFAMKIMNKDFIIEKNQVFPLFHSNVEIAHTRAERDAMVAHDNPFIVKLHYAFQDEIFLYFVMEYSKFFSITFLDI